MVLPDIKKGKDMINILPFEIISRNTKTLLITYISSVDITHEGMKKVLESLRSKQGIISEYLLDKLLDESLIDKDKGKEFLITTGVINKTKTSPLWVNSVIISDVPHLFSNAREQWKSDGVFVSHIIDIKDNNIRGLTLSGTKTHVKQRFLPLTPLLMVSDDLWSPVLPA
ncbi:MAG: McbB family protein [Escherichia coli]